jgi:hypothetical protein
MVERAASEPRRGERATWADERESELSGVGNGPGALWTGAGTASALVPPRSR